MHTEFSIKDGMLNPKKVVHKAIASGMKALAITDATAMFGDVIFYKAASAASRFSVRTARLLITTTVMIICVSCFWQGIIRVT